MQRDTTSATVTAALLLTVLAGTWGATSASSVCDERIWFWCLASSPTSYYECDLTWSGARPCPPGTLCNTIGFTTAFPCAIVSNVVPPGGDTNNTGGGDSGNTTNNGGSHGNNSSSNGTHSNGGGDTNNTGSGNTTNNGGSNSSSNSGGGGGTCSRGIACENNTCVAPFSAVPGRQGCFPRSLGIACGDGVCSASSESVWSCFLDCGLGSAPTVLCPASCAPPSCRCASLDIPGGVPLSRAPQFLLLTLDDDLTAESWPFIKRLLDSAPADSSGRRPVITFFTNTDAMTNWTLLKAAISPPYSCEIASHTAQHDTSLSTTGPQWDVAIGDSVTAIKSHLGVSPLGFRAPYVAWNRAMFSSLGRLDFLYDSSVTSSIPTLGGYLWPFTLTYGLPEIGQADPVFQGLGNIWEIPYSSLTAPGEWYPSWYTDPPDTDLFQILQWNLQQHLWTNKAPFGVFLHCQWFTASRTDALIKFLQFATTVPSLRYATSVDVIHWTQSPSAS